MEDQVFEAVSEVTGFKVRPREADEFADAVVRPIMESGVNHGKAPQHWGCRGAFRVASELGVFEATKKQTYWQVQPSATCIFAGPACTGADSDPERATPRYSGRNPGSRLPPLNGPQFGRALVVGDDVPLRGSVCGRCLWGAMLGACGFGRLAIVQGLPEGFRFRDLRHDFASLLIAQGLDVKMSRRA